MASEAISQQQVYHRPDGSPVGFSSSSRCALAYWAPQPRRPPCAFTCTRLDGGTVVLFHPSRDGPPPESLGGYVKVQAQCEEQLRCRRRLFGSSTIAGLRIAREGPPPVLAMVQCSETLRREQPDSGLSLSACAVFKAQVVVAFPSPSMVPLSRTSGQDTPPFSRSYPPIHPGK